MAANGQAYVVKMADLASAKNKSISPIALIFSTKTSSLDQGHGWTHGYAISLKRGPACIWGPYIDTNLDNKTTVEQFKADKDGYTNTYVIGEVSDFPAFYNAIRFKNTTPTAYGSSGWFLPSAGQIYDYCMNILGCPATDDYTWNHDPATEICIFYKNDGRTTNAYNTYYAPAANYGTVDPEIFLGRWWTSTESSQYYLYEFGIESIRMYIRTMLVSHSTGDYGDKQGGRWYVVPAIAF
jgi:hypothetical protein